VTRPDDSHFPGNEGADDAALDRLLATARWDEPEARVLERSRAQWRALRTGTLVGRDDGTRRTRVWRIAAAVAIAASISAVVFLRSFRWTAPRGNGVHVIHASADAEESALPLPPPQTQSRAATLAERLVVESAAVRADRNPRPAPTPLALEQLRDALRSVERDLHVAPQAARLLAASVGADRSARYLTDMARSRQAAHRAAAVRLLSEIGDERSLPLLGRLGADPELRASAFPGILRLSGSEELKALLAAAGTDERRQITMELLRRGEVQPLLSQIEATDTRAAALQMVRTTSDPPVEALLRALEGPRIDERFAAARALAEICGARGAGDRLRRMIESNQHRREALAALMLCRDAAASEFLERARANRSIDSEIRALESELAKSF
jgi:hypothetical protein